MAASNFKIPCIRFTYNYYGWALGRDTAEHQVSSLDISEERARESLRIDVLVTQITILSRST
jgi:hypothetical protein